MSVRETEVSGHFSQNSNQKLKEKNDLQSDRTEGPKLPTQNHCNHIESSHEHDPPSSESLKLTNDIDDNTKDFTMETDASNSKLDDPHLRQPKTTNSDSESSSSDSDQEASSGYVLLPQDPQQDSHSDNDDVDVDASDRTEQDTCLNELEDNTSFSVDGKDEDESSEYVQAVSKLEESKVEAIKQAMAGFSLPSSSTPDWAKVVPEDVWKTKLIKGLKNTKPHRKQ